MRTAISMRKFTQKLSTVYSQEEKNRIIDKKRRRQKNNRPEKGPLKQPMTVGHIGFLKHQGQALDQKIEHHSSKVTFSKAEPKGKIKQDLMKNARDEESHAYSIRSGPFSET